MRSWYALRIQSRKSADFHLNQSQIKQSYISEFTKKIWRCVFQLNDLFSDDALKTEVSVVEYNI